MINFLKETDTAITLYVNGFHNDFFDQFMYLFSGRFIWIPMYAMILVILFRNYKIKPAVVMMFGIGLTILLTDQLCATYIRPVLERLRPANLENPISELIHVVNDYRGGSYGFPSCHAANSFALVSFLAMLVPKRRFLIFIFLWAVLNSYSRLYLGVHYLGDLTVGAIIGSIIGICCYCLSVFVIKSKFISKNEEIYKHSSKIWHLESYDPMIITGVLITITIVIISFIRQ